MPLQFYRLEGHEIVPCSHEEWMQRFDRPEERRIARTEIGERVLSTVFLGYDQSYGFGPPSFFETMLLGGEGNDYCRRWATYQEAVAGHTRLVARLAAGEEVDNPG